MQTPLRSPRAVNDTSGKVGNRVYFQLVVVFERRWMGTLQPIWSALDETAEGAQ